MKVIDPLKLKSKLTSLNVETLLRAEIAVMKSLVSFFLFFDFKRLIDYLVTLKCD